MCITEVLGCLECSGCIRKYHIWLPGGGNVSNITEAPEDSGLHAAIDLPVTLIQECATFLIPPSRSKPCRRGCPRLADFEIIFTITIELFPVLTMVTKKTHTQQKLKMQGIEY